MEQKVKVSGMSCQHCVQAIESAVGGLTGVEKVDVLLEKHEVTVRYNSDVVSISEIEQEIEDQGYDIEQQ
ncbi:MULTISPECIES: copper chaperone CopZ [Bacillaceae]|uniref:Copper chaperone CopZ n=2 Tax=Bacillaceae TaxID=186817 RepID=A0A9D5DQ33_9BACI|nr:MULTISPECIES: copper chaperone CopZ [Bacillaceae]KQL58083.1 copper resistance protein CopZ [Alkalicoccobacillus plakortidis]MBG9784160.1 copper resistance protein CopZ [Shouchella lehensis]RQW20830.1 copper resistance protein CopZ [Bacillus sp. C1-1]TES50855.1 copper chaperone CopZ [Shouchella lehensis]